MRGLDVLDSGIMKLDPELIKTEISVTFFINKLLKILKETFLLHLSIFQDEFLARFSMINLDSGSKLELSNPLFLNEI